MSSSKSERCKGTTQKGVGCKLKRSRGSEYCFRHQSQEHYEAPLPAVVPREKFGALPAALIGKITDFLDVKDKRQAEQVNREFFNEIVHTIKHRLSFCVDRRTYSKIIFVDIVSLFRKKEALPVLRKAEEVIFSKNLKTNISPLNGMSNIKKIWLGPYFNGDISDIKGLDNLECLSLGDINKPIDFLTNFPNLKCLKFGWNFNQPIDVLATLPNLEQLEFGWLFNHSIEPLTKLTKLKYLHLGENFSSPISSLSKITSLEHLEFRFSVGRDINHFGNLRNLKYLSLRGFFNYPIDDLIACKELEYLQFGSFFNKPIEPLYNLSKLKYLELNPNYNNITIPGVEVSYKVLF